MIVRRRDAVIAEPVGAASASLNRLTAHEHSPYERTDECVEDRRTANRGLHSPCGNNDRSKTGWRYVSCCRKTVDRGSPDPHGVFSFHARRARRPTPATAGRENPRGRNPDWTRVRPMGLPISGEDTSGDRPAPSDAPPGRVVRSFCQPRGQEVQQSRSPPVLEGAAGTVKARRSDRGREEPLLSRRPMMADNRRVRSVWQSDSAARETAALSVTAEGHAHTRPLSCGPQPRSEEHPYAIFKRRSDLAGLTTRSGIPA